MRYIQTLYYNDAKDPLKEGFGWCRPEYNLMSWALSCLQLKKLYGNVELYSDDKGADLLVDKLGLPYTTVHTNFNSFDNVNDKLWALPKLYTYSLQTSPFLHIDGDVFLFEELPSKLLKSGLIAQNPEVATEYYIETQKQLTEHFTYFPTTVKDDFESGIPIKAVNAGILGGTNINFFQEYTEEAFRYVKLNKEHLNNIDAEKFNVFFEQHLFYVLALNDKQKIDYLFQSLEKSDSYTHLADFHETPHPAFYLHLLGHYKKDEDTCIQMAAKLRELYPEYYYRIVQLFQDKNLPFYIQLPEYILEGDNYQNLHAYSTEAFRDWTQNISLEQSNLLCDNPTEGEKSLVANMDSSLLSFNSYKTLSNIRLSDDDELMDIECFKKQLATVLKYSSRISPLLLYGRDIKAQGWYKEVFKCSDSHSIECHKNKYHCGEKDEISLSEELYLIQSKGIAIIKSTYNWAGLLNKYRRYGVDYYNKLNIHEKGVFYCLAIPSLTHDILLFDIDEIEMIVFKALETKHTIEQIIVSCEQYFDEDVVNNYYFQYKEYIYDILKRMLLMKAIMPILS